MKKLLTLTIMAFSINAFAQSSNIGINVASPERNLHINNTIRLEPRDTAPSNPVKGDIYFDGKINTLRYYDGTAWQCGCGSTDEVWNTKAPMPTARVSAGAAVVNNLIYVIGGNDGTTGSSAIVEVYDPLSNTWSTKAPMPTGRGELGVAAVNGKIYAIGGYNGSALNTVEEYDPIGNTWTTRAPMPTPRSAFSIEVINNKIYAVGGWQGCFNVLEEYDPVLNTWATKTPISIGKVQNNGCAVWNGNMFFLGGKNCTSTIFYKSNEVYNPLLNTWTPKADMPFERFGGTATTLNNEIHYIGGADSLRTTLFKQNNNHYVYHPLTNKWTYALDLSNNRGGHVAASVNGKLYIIGGETDNGVIVNWNEEY